MHELSQGVLKTILRGGHIDDPILQITFIKKLNNNVPTQTKYRITVSDGLLIYKTTILTTNENAIPTAKSIIKATKYTTSWVNQTNQNIKKLLLLIMEYELLVDGNDVSEVLNEDELIDAEATDLTKEEPPAKKQCVKNEVAATTSRNLPNMNTFTLTNAIIMPISSISPYHNNWTIKARAVFKSPIRSWSNSRGEGTLFSVHLIDESGEIKATAFRDLVNKFYDVLQLEQIYYISKCQVKDANKRFSNLNNDYELTFTNESVVQECLEIDTNVPSLKFDFKPIASISNMQIDEFIDVIGVCKSASDLQTIIKKSTGTELKKRELLLIDKSNCSVLVTLWGNDAESYDYDKPVIAIKGGKVNEFAGGKNITIPGTATVKYNPEIEEAIEIRSWYDNGGCNVDAPNISAKASGGGNFETRWLNFRNVKDMNLGQGERPDYFQSKGTILLLKSENCFYRACPQANCNKRIIDMENGQYKCEKCNANYPTFKYHLLSQVNICDWSDNLWTSFFSTELEQVLGKTSHEVGTIATENPELLASIISDVTFKEFIFKCRAKTETFNDETRLKTNAVRVDPINHKEYNTHIISQIHQLVGLI